jgi:hypothetical protein
MLVKIEKLHLLLHLSVSHLHAESSLMMASASSSDAPMVKKLSRSRNPLIFRI